MADLDAALEEALALYNPSWRPPDTSVFMQQQAELIDWDEREDPRRDDEADDFTVDDVHDRPHGWVSGPC